MKHHKLLLAILLFTALSMGKVSAQFSSISLNTLGYATGNINVAFGFKVDGKRSVDIPLSFSPVSFDKIGWKNVTFTPGMRFWHNEIYHGSYFGFHAIGSYFSIISNDRNNIGWAAGAGASYGYAFFLTKRWNLDLEIGAGLVYTIYDDKDNIDYGPFDDEVWSKHNSLMLIPSRARVSFSYLF